MHCHLGGCTIATVYSVEVEVVAEEAEAEGGGDVQLAEMEVSIRIIVEKDVVSSSTPPKPAPTEAVV